MWVCVCLCVSYLAAAMASPKRLAVAISSANVRSAVVSVRQSGVNPSAIRFSFKTVCMYLHPNMWVWLFSCACTWMHEGMYASCIHARYVCAWISHKVFVCVITVSTWLYPTLIVLTIFSLPAACSTCTAPQVAAVKVSKHTEKERHVYA